MGCHKPVIVQDENDTLRPVKEHLQQGYTGPFLMIDSNIIRQQARRFMTALPRVTPHFAVKSNPDSRILQTLKEEGTQFEIASRAELDLLLALNIRPADIFYSNPVKSSLYISYAAEKGVEWYAIDCVEELYKIHQIKPDAKLYLRIYTTNEGSACPLSGKFGAHLEDTRHIIEEAASLGADLAGVTFHVGSQCNNLENWRVGIRAAEEVFTLMRQKGLNPRMLNLGGGYPVPMGNPVHSIDEIAEVINQELNRFPSTVKIIAEPGRYMVAEAGCLVSSVVGTTQRNGERWLYLDTGFYSGLMELKDGIPYVLDTDHDSQLVPWTIAGPTCDSVDVCSQNYPLPSTIREGDIIYVRSAGAYSNACVTEFNGFPSPEVIVI